MWFQCTGLNHIVSIANCTGAERSTGLVHCVNSMGHCVTGVLEMSAGVFFYQKLCRGYCKPVLDAMCASIAVSKWYHMQVRKYLQYCKLCLPWCKSGCGESAPSFHCSGMCIPYSRYFSRGVYFADFAERLTLKS